MRGMSVFSYFDHHKSIAVIYSHAGDSCMGVGRGSGFITTTTITMVLVIFSNAETEKEVVMGRAVSPIGAYILMYKCVSILY